MEAIETAASACGSPIARQDGDTIRTRTTALIVATEWVVLLAAATYLCGRTLPRAWQHLNTDFPNYYLAARLLREGYNTDRLYEWTWFQRQKDHLAIDQPVVGFAPNPPSAALVALPLTYWSPLTAKRVWIVTNLTFLVAIAVLLHSLTRMVWRRIALLMLLSFPMHRNLLYGQYYILLLLLVTVALWLYIRQKRTVAGLLVGIGFGVKIFPALFFLYFLRKKDFKAAIGLVTGCVVTLLAAVVAFGWQLNQHFFQQVLPWGLRGEGLDPYNLAANSFAALLHHLFMFEPEWNPHPLLHMPALLGILLPLLQIVIMAPAILLSMPRNMRPCQLKLEWSAFMTSLLTISTMPASYHFTLLILPVALMTAVLVEDRRFVFFAVLTATYFGINVPLWRSTFSGGLSLLGVPRLYLLICLCLYSWILLRKREQPAIQQQRDQRLWAAALACALVLEVAVSLRHLHQTSGRQSERIRTSPVVFLAAQPVTDGTARFFVSMLSDGYHAVRLGNNGIQYGGADQLAITAAAHRVWVEESTLKSKIVVVGPDLTARHLEVDNAESPAASPDGRWLAYLQSERGRSRVWLHPLEEPVSDRPITPPGLNVLEMSFFPDNSIVFTAAEDHHAPRLFLTDGHSQVQQITAEEARFPAISPDGRLLAYSRQSRGVWNLWLKNMQTGEERRITNADCNDVYPEWEADSKTLFYASDCGRGFGLTALYRRHVIP